MPENMSAEKRRQKLSQLVEIEVFESIAALCAATIADSVSPAICMNEAAITRPRWSRIRIAVGARSDVVTTAVPADGAPYPSRSSRHGSSPAGRGGVPTRSSRCD